MDDIPIEIWKLIALNLKPGILVRISKMFDIYDELWYRDYLLMRYNESEIVNRDFSYKELCQRSLLEGLLCAYDLHEKIKTNLEIRGIAAVPKNNYYFTHHVLKFNGDIIKTNSINNKIIHSNVIKIDYNVIKIDYNCYIKKTELYYHHANTYNTIKFPLTNTQILNIQYIKTFNSITLCQFYTKNSIYFNYNDATNKTEIQTFNITYTIIKTLTESYINHMYITYILTKKRILLIYFNKNFTDIPIIINNVDDIGRNYIHMNDKYYYIDAKTIDFNKCSFGTENLVCLMDNRKLMNHYYGGLITDKKIILFDSEYKIVYILEVDAIIKNFFSTYGRTYLIEY